MTEKRFAAPTIAVKSDSVVANDSGREDDNEAVSSASSREGDGGGYNELLVLDA